MSYERARPGSEDVHLFPLMVVFFIPPGPKEIFRETETTLGRRTPFLSHSIHSRLLNALNHLCLSSRYRIVAEGENLRRSQFLPRWPTTMPSKLMAKPRIQYHLLCALVLGLVSESLLLRLCVFLEKPNSPSFS